MNIVGGLSFRLAKSFLSGWRDVRHTADAVEHIIHEHDGEAMLLIYVIKKVQFDRAIASESYACETPRLFKVEFRGSQDDISFIIHGSAGEASDITV